MAVQFDDLPDAKPVEGLSFDDLPNAKPPGELSFDDVPEGDFWSRSAATRGKLGVLYAPARSVSSAVSDYVSRELTPSRLLSGSNPFLPPPFPLSLLEPAERNAARFLPGWEQLKSGIGGSVGGLVSSPLHPATYSALAATALPATAPAMIPLTGALMAGEELTQPRPNLPLAGLLGAFGAGGALLPHVLPGRPRASPIVERVRPGVPPESWLIPQEPVSITEAAAAAQEAGRMAPRPYRPINPPLRTAAELAMERPTPSPVEAIAPDISQYKKGQRQFGGFIELPEEAPTAEKLASTLAAPALVPDTHSRVQRVLQALKESKPLTREQQALYRIERGKRAGEAQARAESVGGQAGFFEEKAALAGKLPEVKFRPLQEQVSQDDINGLMDTIKTTLPFWESISARTGFQRMLDGQLPRPHEVKLLQQVFGKELPAALQARKGMLQKSGDLAFQLMSSMRTVSAGFGDMSWALRQGVVTLPRHPVVWSKAFAQMHLQYVSPKFYAKSQAAIRARPTYPLMMKHKLELTDMGESIRGREETYQATLPEKIPGLRIGIRAGNRAYTGMANRVRADLFDQYVKISDRLGLEDPKFLDDAASHINNLTGRGQLRIPFVGRGLEPEPALEAAAPILNATIFSPRLWASRLNLLDWSYYPKLHPLVRREAIKDLLAFLGAGTATVGGAALFGATAGTDYRSADFGKIKIGKNLRLDIWGSFQQPVVVALRLATGKMVSSVTGREFTLGEGYRATDRVDILLRHLQSKASPIASLVIGWMKGKSETGQPFRFGPELIDRYIPMVLDDVDAVMKEAGQDAWGWGTLSFYGVGVQAYGKQIPLLETTPSGRQKIGFRPPPTIGEDIVNAVTGQTISTIPTKFHPALEQARQRELTQQMDIDKAKRLTLEDGKTRQVGSVKISLKNGVVKTKRQGRKPTPERRYEQQTDTQLRK